MYVLNFIRGFCMALADSVPGVSGGTIAFILGFYDEFVISLNNIISKDKIKRIEGIRFIYKIGIGWISGMILSILFITSIFEKNIYGISSLFLGFIIASIPLIVKSEKDTLINNKKDIKLLVLGILIVTSMTYLNSINTSNVVLSLKLESMNISRYIYVFISGLIAISAMVLPGISGSTILLIFGLYAPILNAIKNVLVLKFEYLPSIIVFSLGIILGVLITVRLVRNILKKYRSKSMYIIVGLMIGSMYAVIMGPTSLEIPHPPMNINNINILAFLIGITLVPLLEKSKSLLKEKEENTFDKEELE